MSPKTLSVRPSAVGATGGSISLQHGWRPMIVRALASSQQISKWIWPAWL
ncbi:hypothetical protein WKW80_14060 [Variovorax humicola]|uniref:Uncharacterized protein n=1 Tax=Variovorax humicola TaxID=1769758 RepID=A0ABU8W1A1_9BURK